MATTIVTKNGTGAPTDSDLVAGELAVDLTNGRLYTTDLDSGGTVIEIGLNPSGNVDVTGTVTADGLTVDGSTTFTGNTSPASDEVLLNLSSLNGTGTAGNMLRFTDLDPTATNNGSIGKIQFYSDDTDAVVVEIEGQNADASPDGRLIFKTAEGTTLRKRINIENNGDISFYEDTGTTAKFFWDASAESLGIGTAAPAAAKFSSTPDGVLNLSGNKPVVYLTEEDETDSNVWMGLSNGVGIIGNTGVGLAFRTGASTATERMRIDSSGRVGIGVTPSTLWSSSYDALQIGLGGSVYAHGGAGSNMQMAANSVYEGIAPNYYDKYLTSSTASKYVQDSGLHIWSTAASGTAGDAITWSEAMRIDASGNVGIGTDSPTSLLGGKVTEITNSSNTSTTADNQDLIVKSVNRFSAINVIGSNTGGSQLNFGDSDDSDVGGIQYDHTNNYLITRVNGAERMRIDSSGTTTFTKSGGGNIRIAETASRYAEIFGYAEGTANGSTMAFHTIESGTSTSTERMRLDSSGNLLVGTTSATVSADAGFRVLSTRPATTQADSTSGTTVYEAYSTGAGAFRFYVDMAGTVHATSTSITAISDESLKENIRDLDKGLDTIKALKPRRFDWKNGDGNDIMGFVAQEVQDVLPELVHDYKLNETETKLGLKMGDMIPSLVKAIQEQQATIEALTARIAALES